MAKVKKLPNLKFLSELYFEDSPEAWLLAEYPSSNSDETRFQNRNRFIIHDPFPPPRRELMKVLGPHHLMCGWGSEVEVTSEVEPPASLLEHWRGIFGDKGCPNWRPFEEERNFITLFPHESIPPEQQVVDPVINYQLHSKEVIGLIDCPQADVLESIQPPCIVKLSHGYAGLGNYFIRNEDDLRAMQEQVSSQWPEAVLVANSILENIVGDFGVQFYLQKNGTPVWLGFTQQLFNDQMRWCGGTFSSELQLEMFEPFCRMIEPTAEYLCSRGYFGVVGIDILQNKAGELFLVDVNPRLTGISPFLMASRIFGATEGMGEGIYQASHRFAGTLKELISRSESFEDARVLVLSAFEDPMSLKESDAGRVDHNVETVCHISVTSESQVRNRQILKQIF